MKGQPDKTDALSQGDLDKIAGLLDERIAPLATNSFVKEEVNTAINASEKRIKSYIDEGFETVMNGLDNITKLLAEKERVDRLEKWAIEVSQKVGIKLKI